MKCMVLGIGRGSSGVIEDATDADVRRIVGEQFDQVASSDGKFTVYIHELWLVADLPLNAAASAMAGVVIGGPAVIIPLDQETPVDKTFNPTFHSFLIERAVVIEDKLEALYEQNRTQKNFVLVDSDRWIYNGKVFAAIVVSSDEEPDDSEPRRHNIWFFAPGSMDPFSVRMVDYSLREVLEDLILGDEAAAEGRIQETLGLFIVNMTLNGVSCGTLDVDHFANSPWDVHWGGSALIGGGGVKHVFDLLTHPFVIMVMSTQIPVWAATQKGAAMSAITYTHLYVLLDRSGSMSSIANDVIGGYNTFIREQKKVGSDVRVTLVQFDSQDRQEIIAAGVPIDELVELTAETFIPRGGTPLLDATGLLIARARTRQEMRTQNSLPAEDIVFVTVTDGEENESSEYTLPQIKKLIEKCEADGWTFVFLSAAIDAYGDASRMGMKGGNIQAFSASAHGADLAFSSLSANVSKLRKEKTAGTWKQDADFFEQKIAEAERRKKDEN